MGSRSPRRRGNFGGYPAHVLKSIVSYCCGVRSKKTITASARLLQPTALLPTGRCLINSPGEKSASPAMRPLVNIFDHLLLLLLLLLLVVVVVVVVIV